MHNIKSIRENPDFYKKKLEERNLKVNFKDLLDLDKKNRETIQKKEKYEQERKSISKKKDEAQFAKSKKISKEIKSLEESQESLRKKINEILNFLPNIALDDVPVGKDDKFNKELNKVGDLPTFKFQPKSHYEIGKKMNLMDFETATKTSGSRFVFL